MLLNHDISVLCGLIILAYRCYGVARRYPLGYRALASPLYLVSLCYYSMPLTLQYYCTKNPYFFVGCLAVTPKTTRCYSYLPICIVPQSSPTHRFSASLRDILAGVSTFPRQGLRDNLVKGWFNRCQDLSAPNFTRALSTLLVTPTYIDASIDRVTL